MGQNQSNADYTYSGANTWYVIHKSTKLGVSNVFGKSNTPTLTHALTWHAGAGRRADTRDPILVASNIYTCTFSGGEGGEEAWVALPQPLPCPVSKVTAGMELVPGLWSSVQLFAACLSPNAGAQSLGHLWQAVRRL